jgi:ABC-type sugar transport system ATPase subunit
VKLLAGVESMTSGEYYYMRRPMQELKLYDFVKNGIIYMAEDAPGNLVMNQDTQYNMSLPVLDKFMSLFLVSRKKTNTNAQNYINKLNIKQARPNTTVRWLSRGTQQKVALSKWIEADSRVLVLDEPSITLDTASKVELYNILNKMAQGGKAILMASSDLTELIGMCDRIYVMFSGRIVAEFEAKETNSVKILQYALGKKHRLNKNIAFEDGTHEKTEP